MLLSTGEWHWDVAVFTVGLVVSSSNRIVPAMMTHSFLGMPLLFWGRRFHVYQGVLVMVPLIVWIDVISAK
jgi:hypothetical protein